MNGKGKSTVEVTVGSVKVTVKVTVEMTVAEAAPIYHHTGPKSFFVESVSAALPYLQ